MLEVKSKSGYTHQRVLKQLSLGTFYTLHWAGSKKPSILVKCIKVTNKGYNLLNVNSNECVLYPHLYPTKYSDLNAEKLLFSVNSKMQLTISEN